MVLTLSTPEEEENLSLTPGALYFVRDVMPYFHLGVLSFTGILASDLGYLRYSSSENSKTIELEW